MKKILITLTALSMAFAGTGYFQYDTEEDAFMTVGYHHPVKDFGSWAMYAGGSYDLSSDAEVSFMKVYMLDVYPINEKFSLWGSLGYGHVMDGGDLDVCDADSGLCTELDGGLNYGLGFHYKLNDSWGVGIGRNVQSIDYTLGDVDLLELLGEDDSFSRTDIHFSYKFDCCSDSK